MINKKQAGFTLVEIAVVMVIVGFLIGGILQGREMIKNAQVTRTISDARGIQVLTTQFEDKYGYMPGDFDALNRISGCESGNANSCLGGNGNGSVGGFRGVDDVAWRTVVTGRSETLQFWKHLALANFITTVDASSDFSTLAWSESHPAAAVGGGYEFYYDALTTIGFAGHILRLSLDGVAPTGGMVGVLTPDQAAQIDRKMDDGMAGSGKVFADYGVNSNACKTNDLYNEGASATCILYFVLFR